MSPTITSNGTRRTAPAEQARPALPLTKVAAQRNRSRVTAGVLVLLACTLGAVIVFGKVGDRQSVLVMARTVDVGDVVEAADLRSVRVSADAGVQAVPASARAQVIGRPAAVRLISGSLLSPAEVGGDTRLPKGMALVGAVLKAGQFPLGLAPGDTVALVASGTGEVLQARSDSDQQPVTGTVVAMEAAADAIGSTAVSLQVPTAAASDAATAGAAGRLNLVVVER